jgi:transposase-like protein
LLTFFQFPKHQRRTLRTTNVTGRLNEEFRQHVKTQGALPTEDASTCQVVQTRMGKARMGKN